MIRELMNNLMKVETKDEILTFKPQIMDLYNVLCEKMRSQICSITNFDDIKMLNDLESHMMAYYGPHFYNKCGIPFLKEHNPETIDILELSVLFYSLQIISLIENGFYLDTSLCFYKNPMDDIFDHVEKIDLTEYRYKQNLFNILWFYFVQVVTLDYNTREFTIEYDDKQDIFYLSTEKYEEVIDMIYKNVDGSQYYQVVKRILGQYRMRFTKMEYILKYQPLFVNAGYKYLCTLTEE